ncbi:ATP-grasp domain-containing protein, partial [Streptomyces sp. DSM 41013]
VLKADTVQHLGASIDLLTPGGLGCLVQPYVPDSGDVRVYVHEGKVIAALLREPAGRAYLANASQGGNVSGYEAPAEIADLSERLARSLHSDYLCVDWLISGESFSFNEWMTVSVSSVGRSASIRMPDAVSAMRGSVPMAAASMPVRAAARACAECTV